MAARTRMECVTQMEDSVAVVRLSGDVDLESSPRLRKTLLAGVEARGGVLVEMAGVSYIDSSGVASLVEAFQAARKNGSVFGLVAVSAPALRVLQLARLQSVFAIHDTLDGALATLGR